MVTSPAVNLSSKLVFFPWSSCLPPVPQDDLVEALDGLPCLQSLELHAAPAVLNKLVALPLPALATLKLEVLSDADHLATCRAQVRQLKLLRPGVEAEVAVTLDEPREELSWGGAD